MYWQVYLHKTVLSAEQLMIKILKRAKQLAQNGTDLFATPALELFLKNNFIKEDFKSNINLLDKFSLLDDYDIFTSTKVWKNHEDKILSTLSSFLVDRKLYKIELQNTPFDIKYINSTKENTIKHFSLKEEDVDYFVFSDVVINNAYDSEKDGIKILYKNNEVKDISAASDQLNNAFLSKAVKKYLLCYPKNISY